jgi:hypothetical protein
VVIHKITEKPNHPPGWALFSVRSGVYQMWGERLFSLSLCIVISSLLMITGCSKRPIVKMAEPLPPIIREYRHIILRSAPDMQNTAIYVDEGDIYSILATGSIRMWRRARAPRLQGRNMAGHSWRELERRTTISIHLSMEMPIQLPPRIRDTCI